MDHFRKLMIENLNQPVKITKDGQVAEVSAFEAVLQRLLQQAIHGKSNPSLRQYIELAALCMRAQEAWEQHTVELLMNLHTGVPPGPRESVSGNTPIIFK